MLFQLCISLLHLAKIVHRQFIALPGFFDRGIRLAVSCRFAGHGFFFRFREAKLRVAPAGDKRIADGAQPLGFLTLPLELLLKLLELLFDQRLGLLHPSLLSGKELAGALALAGKLAFEPLQLLRDCDFSLIEACSLRVKKFPTAVAMRTQRRNQLLGPRLKTGRFGWHSLYDRRFHDRHSRDPRYNP